jgi:lipopolysaccharide export system permease protein
VRIQPQALEEATESPRRMTMGELLARPTRANMAELVWRVGYPISALLLALLAVPMSYVNPRAGRSLNVVFAILIYLAYNNFVGLSEGWVMRGRMNAGEALLLIHGSMLLVLTAFFWQRFRGPWSR